MSKPIVIVFEADTSGLAPKIKDLTKGVKDFSDANEKASKSTQNTAEKAKMAWTEFRSMYSTVLDVVRAGKQVFDFAKEGAQLEYASIKFDRLSTSVGTFSNILLNDLRAATRGLYSDSELLASAGDLASLGLAKSHDEIVRLSTVASGLNMNMNQLVLTLTNQTTMRFDALGVSTDGFKEKMEELEKQGYSTDAAFKEAFLQQAEAQLEKVGHAADSSIGSFMRLEAQWKNISDAFKEDFAKTLLPLVDFMVKLGDEGEETKRKVAAYNQEMIRTGGVLINSREHYNANREVVEEFWQEHLKSEDAQRENIRATEDFDDALDANSSALDDNKEAVKAAEEALRTYKEQLEAVSKANQDAESFIQKYADYQTRYAEDHAKATQALMKATEEGNAESIESAKKNIQDLEAQWHESTQKMIYDMVLAKVSIDGLTDAEFNATQDLAVSMGIRTQAQADEAKAMMEKANAIADGIALQEDVAREKQAMDEKLLELENAKAIAAGETTAAVIEGSAQSAEAMQQVTDATFRQIEAQRELQRQLQTSANMYSNLNQSSGGGSNTSTRTNRSSGGTNRLRDTGGSGIAGVPYMIGIGAQPEMYIPETNGTFVPNADKVMGGKTYNITIYNPKRETAEGSMLRELQNLSYIGVAE